MSRNWYDNLPSTELDRNPDPLTLKAKTITDLFTFAEQSFGFNETFVRNLMRSAGIRGFLPDSWFTYTSLIRKAYEFEQARKEFPTTCPICGTPTERKSEWDHKWKRGGKWVPWGWKCTAVEGHFMEWLWQPLKAFFYRHKEDPDARQAQDQPG